MTASDKAPNPSTTTAWSRSTPGSKHNTPRITREDFRAGYMNPGAYSLEDISSALVDHLSQSRDELTPTQFATLEEIRHQRGWNFADPENMHDLRKAFNTFNEILFNGVLTGHCEELRWYDRRHLGTEAGYCQHYLVGEELDPRYKIEKPRASIYILKIYGKSPMRKVEDYLDFLVHEMVHALFATYACNCKKGCAEKLQRHLGPWGGPCALFQAAAHAIEQVTALNPIAGIIQLMPLDLTTYRYYSFTIAINNGCDLPTDTELRRLGLDIVDIREDLKGLREEKAAKWREELNKQQLRRANKCLSWDIERTWESG